MSIISEIYGGNYRVDHIDADAKKACDVITRVILKNETSEITLDVNDNLYKEISNVGYNVDVQIADKIGSYTARDSYNPKIIDEFKKIPNLNYVMHGTVFEFRKKTDKDVAVCISFGGLIMQLVAPIDKIDKFKYGMKIYLICSNTRPGQ